MAIDYSFLEGVAPQQQQQAAPQDDVANVTLRVDADAMLLCDGEYMDIHLKGGVITKVQLPVGQHLLEFLSEKNPDVKVEKVADFPAAGKSYLVMVNDLKAALEQSHTQAAVALGSKRVYRLVVVGYDNQMGAMMTARAVMGWSSAESREKFAVLPAVVAESEDSARIESLAGQFAKGNVTVTVETRNGLGELVDSHSLETPAQVEAKRKAAEEAAKRKEAEAAANKEAARLAEMSTYELNKLGEEYYKGDNGKQKNYTEAVKYYRASADRGDSYAQYVIGHCYYFGQGVEKDCKEAAKWYRMAAEKGNRSAMKGLGDCYNFGKGVEKDCKEAVKWYRMAAEKGNLSAMICLGDCYLNNRGVIGLPSDAVEWYHKAAAKGDRVATEKLKELKERGVPVDAYLLLSNGL